MYNEHYFSHSYISQKLSKNNRFENLRLEKNLKIFKQLYQTNSVRETAKALNLSPATISKSIVALEDALQVKLFNRHGCEGVSPTSNADTLMERSDDFKNSIDNLKNDFNIKKQMDISILAHKLAFMPYIFPAINKANITTKKIDLISKDIHEIHNILFLDNIDIVLFPLPVETIAQIDSNKYNVIKLSQYHIYLYLNKQNILSNKNEKDWTFNDLKKAHIVPQGKMMFPFFKKLLFQPEDYLNDYKNIYTESLDISLLYEGIKRNYWSCGIGKEFEEIFDCSQFSKKDYHKSNFVGTIIYWFLIIKKDTAEQTKSLTDAIIETMKAKNSNNGFE